MSRTSSGMEHNSGPEPHGDSTTPGDRHLQVSLSEDQLSIMDVDQIARTDPPPGAAPPRVADEAGGDHDHGGGNNPTAFPAPGGNRARNGVNPVGIIVDDFLAVLPVPSRDHIFADEFGVDFHAGM